MLINNPFESQQAPQDSSVPPLAPPAVEKETRKGRGFASMDPERQRQIASEGGRAAHQLGRAHEFTPEEARIAGRKGGQARGESHQQNR